MRYHRCSMARTITWPWIHPESERVLGLNKLQSGYTIIASQVLLQFDAGTRKVQAEFSLHQYIRTNTPDSVVNRTRQNEMRKA